MGSGLLVLPLAELKGEPQREPMGLVVRTRRCLLIEMGLIHGVERNGFYASGLST